MTIIDATFSFTVRETLVLYKGNSSNARVRLHSICLSGRVLSQIYLWCQFFALM